MRVVIKGIQGIKKGKNETKPFCFYDKEKIYIYSLGFFHLSVFMWMANIFSAAKSIKCAPPINILISLNVEFCKFALALNAR